VARWPAKVRPGTTSDQLVSLVDLMATAAAIVGATLPADAGEDSVSFLPALLGTDRGPLREALVHQSANGRFAIRQGPWKLELCPGSGGWSQPSDPKAAHNGLPPVQLYDLRADLGEQQNLQAQQSAVVKQLTALLERYCDEGRSTPGAAQKNDVPVDLWKTAANRAPPAKPRPKTEAKPAGKQAPGGKA
jgi:arylsulfatase A-like enzyme